MFVGLFKNTLDVYVLLVVVSLGVVLSRSAG